MPREYGTAIHGAEGGLEGGVITEAVQSQGTNVFFDKEEAEAVFEMESGVLRANVAHPGGRGSGPPSPGSVVDDLKES